MNEKKPHPRQASVTPVTYPAPVFSPPALAQSEGRLNDGNEAPASGGPRIEFHRNYCRSVPGSLGIIEVVGAGFIVTALSFRGFIFDVFFFLCNLGFTYTLVGKDRATGAVFTYTNLHSPNCVGMPREMLDGL